MTQELGRSFWRNHFYIPFTLFIVCALTIEFCGIDKFLADYLYALEGGEWALRNTWFAESLIHKAGRNFSLLLLLILLIAIGFSFTKSKVRVYRWQLIYLLIAAGGASLLVSAVKLVNHASCPWDFARYGGKTEYATVFAEFFKGSGSDCFPAAHASAGYAWLALYFLGVYFKSNWRWAGVAFALTLGAIFGITQQLRGAHFISHDLWTLGICWFFSLLCYRVMLSNEKTNG
jgi:membrane-associated PAP2 superfamily phosphatase